MIKTVGSIFVAVQRLEQEATDNIKSCINLSNGNYQERLSINLVKRFNLQVAL